MPYRPGCARPTATRQGRPRGSRLSSRCMSRPEFVARRPARVEVRPAAAASAGASTTSRPVLGRDEDVAVAEPVEDDRLQRADRRVGVGQPLGSARPTRPGGPGRGRARTARRVPPGRRGRSRRAAGRRSVPDAGSPPGGPGRGGRPHSLRRASRPRRRRPGGPPLRRRVPPRGRGSAPPSAGPATAAALPTGTAAPPVPRRCPAPRPAARADPPRPARRAWAGVRAMAASASSGR